MWQILHIGLLMDTNKRCFLALISGLCLAICAGCDVSSGLKPSLESEPRLGVISADIKGDVLLYTDREIVGDGIKIFILSSKLPRTVTCCARIVRRVSLPTGSENFFTNVDSDRSSSPVAYSVEVPGRALTQENPIAVAVWNISSYSMVNDGYALSVSGSTIGYEENSCFGSEGLNIYLKHTAVTEKPVAHYYVGFGYAIDGQNCPKK